MDRWAARLSDYVDGELPARKARALEDHLRGCRQCSDIVAELRGLTAHAGDLRVDVPPETDLWADIERRLPPKRSGRRAFAFAWPLGAFIPRLAAATVLIALVAGGAWWLRRDRSQPHADRTTAVLQPALAARTPQEEEYDRAAAALERDARTRLSRDPQLVDVLDENLATLNVAIANYEEALVESPGDEHLANRLSTVRQRKMDVLRQAAQLSTEGTN